MKRILTGIVVLFILFAASCSGTDKDNGETIGEKTYTELPSPEPTLEPSPEPTQEATQNNLNEVWQKEITDSELDNLVKSFTFPQKSTDNLNFNEACPGLPIELINQLKEAVYNCNSDAFIQELNDKSLMITAKDFTFKPNRSNDIDYSEEDLNNDIQNGASNYLIYKCDTNGDGTDEIVMIQNREYNFSESNCAYILKKSGDKYIFAGYSFLGYYRHFALFQNNGKFYIAANYDDSKTKTTKAIGLFSLDVNNSDFDFIRPLNDHSYIRKIVTGEGYQYYLLYKNINAPIVSEIQTYIEEIGTDLIYAERTNKTFYGNETERNDLLDEAKNSNSETSVWNVNAVDVNNDGKDEFFDRGIYYDGSDMSETGVNWYDPKTISFYPAPFTVWSPTEYLLTQQWFKIIDGKTVIFTLYHKNSEDTYVLDVRINENGQTTILMDYMIDLDANIELSDDWNYDDTNFVQIEYKDLDVEKAFPEDIDQRAKSLATKVQGDFVAANYKHKDIPNSLIVLAEKALFEEKIGQLNMGTASFEISSDGFYDKYGQYTWFESKEDFESYISHIYKYKLGKNTYYITVSDSGGTARFVDIVIYKESKGKLIVLNDWVSLDLDARVIEYNDELYLIESSYNFYSKYTDTINIYKLVPDQIKDYVSITLKPDSFEWKEIYNNQQLYEKSISSYVDSIKDDLMAKSPIDDNIKVYVGDETNKYDEDKKLRIMSVAEDEYYESYDYYEIDFNNDGETEYFEKYFWYPSNSIPLYLNYDIYKFTDKRTIKINGDFDTSLLLQLWFKEIDGKVFTFRLFLVNEYNYLLNVSLVDDANITQVQSYLVVPKREFNIRTQKYEDELLYY